MAQWFLGKACFNFHTKDVNRYSNIRIRSDYSNTISAFEYTHFFSVPAFCVNFLLFRFFLQGFQTQNYRLFLIGGYLKSVISLINCSLVTVVDVLTTIKTIVNSLQIV